MPGTYTLVDQKANNTVAFTVSATGDVGYAADLQGILLGAGTTTLSVNGATITVDATGLTAAQLKSYYGNFASTAPLTFDVLPGHQIITDVGDGRGLYFAVSNSGTVSYDPSLEGVLRGAGTSTLTVQGVAVTIDASALTKPGSKPVMGSLPSTAPFTLRMIPGQQFVDDLGDGAGLYFTVSNSGTVSYDPSLEGVVTGAGTSTLTVQGVAVTIDASALTKTQLETGDGIFASTAPFTLRMIPGQQFIDDLGDDDGLYFKVSNSGTVSYDPSLEGVVTGAGTSTLTVQGVAVTIDASALTKPNWKPAMGLRLDRPVHPPHDPRSTVRR